MGVAIRRLFYYFVETLCLIFLVLVLQDRLHTWLLQAGLTDATTSQDPLDLLSELSIFTNLKVILVVLLVFIVFWFLIRRDLASIYADDGYRIRTHFLSAIAVAFGLRILYEVLLVVHSIDTLFSQSGGLPIAAQTAAVIAWALGLAAAILEWNFGESFEKSNQTIMKFYALLAQWILLVVTFVTGGLAIQSYLQQALSHIPPCAAIDINSHIITTISSVANDCANTWSPIGASVSLAFVLITLIIYAYWESRYTNSVLSNIDAFIGMGMIGVALTLNTIVGVRLFVDWVFHQAQAILPQSLLTTPDTTTAASYAFIGPLVASVCLLVYYGWRQLRREVNYNEPEGWHYAQLGLSYPLALVLFWGTSLLLGHLLAAVLNHFGFVATPVTEIDWGFALARVVPGVFGGWFLWRQLEELGRGDASPHVAGRIYVWTYYPLLLLVAIVSSLLFIIQIVSDLVHMPLDPAHSFTVHLFAFAVITGLAAYYYYTIRRLWRYE